MAKHTFEIPAQKVATALLAFSDQAKVQVLMWAESKPDAKSAGASGKLTSLDALNAILANTGLSFKQIDGETIAIVYPETSASAGVLEEIHLAQTETSVPSPAAGGGAPKGADEERSKIEEIVVTAQKRQERLQDVPISISVLDGATLDRSTVRDVTEMLTRVPGVAVNNMGYIGGSGSQIPIRGVSAGLAFFTGASPTAYYLDSVPFGFVKTAIGPDPEAYDLARVEVLRGPQGTLYGASALNGVVRVLTHDVDLNRFDIKGRALTSSAKEGGWNYRGDMAVNLPIVEGKFAARAVVGYQDLSGWIDKPNDSDANEGSRRNLRLKLNAQPSEQLSIGLSAWSSKSDFDAPSSGLDDMTSTSLIEEPVEVGYDAYGLTVGYDFASVSLSSMTSYLDYTNFSLLDFRVPGFFLTTDLQAETFSEEVILNSTHEGSWRWSVGAMYRDSKDSLMQVISTNPNHAVQHNTSKSHAVFGEATRAFSGGRFELTAGLRYFEDEVSQRAPSTFIGPPPATVNRTSKFDATTPRVALTWHASERTTFYTSYAEGFRSGSNQNPDALGPAPSMPPVNPDTLKNYEVGAKGSLLQGRVSFDAAVYYIDWQDVQQALGVPITSTLIVQAIVNGKSASGSGGEFGLTFNPMDRLQLGANFSWNDLTVDENVISSNRLLFAKGDRLDFSPEYTSGASAEYGFPVGTGGYVATVSASANYTSGQKFTTLAGVTMGDPMLTSRAAFALQAPAHWTATLFVDNLNDEDGAPVQPLNQPQRNARIQPRTVGVQFEYRY